MIPITVLTITYNRYQLLQEAVKSFVDQNRPDCEMLIINDQKQVDYISTIPNVRIINSKTRFPSILDKLLFGFKNAKHYHVYRLDDDDLIGEDKLHLCQQGIYANPGYDLYRSQETQFLSSNVYQGLFGSVNNGNIFTKKNFSSLDREEAAKTQSLSVGEDQYMVYGGNPKVYTFDFPSMIYRWGMGTYHISGMSITDPDEIYKRTDTFNEMEQGTIYIKPVWKTDYYKIVKGAAHG